MKRHFFILIFLVLITYINSLNNAFLSDDLAEIVQNPNIGNLQHAIFTHPLAFIRPVLYSIAFNIGGLNPILFRSINLFFHIASVFLIFVILNKLYSKRLALIVASIFAVHPAISEGVVWISGGMYPQYTFFFLLSFYLYLLSKKKPKIYWASLLTFLGGFMTHPQMPLALFIIFPLWELSEGNLKENWKKSLPFLAITVVYILVTLSALPERTTTLQSVHYQETGIDNPLVLIPVAISSYLELLFFPKNLTLYHSELSFGPIQFGIRAVLTILLMALIIISFKKNKTIFFWLSLFWISLLPTLTPFRLTWVVAERYLYLPSIGIFVSLALTLNFLSKKYQYLVNICLVIILIILSARTIARNIDWKNEDNLWIATGKTSPSSPNTHNNLGDVYGRWGDTQKALQEFQTAIALKPNYADAYHNAGNAYRDLAEFDKALEYYQKAAQFNPNLWQSYQNIAAIYFQNKQYDKALENMQKAITVNPSGINLRNNLGVVYLASGNKQKAKEVFSLVLSVDPQNQSALAGLAEANK